MPAMICTKCKVDKPDTDFPFKNKAKGKRSTVCKECQKGYKLSYYYNKKESHYRRNKETENKLREICREYKLAHPCLVCGEVTPECLDFHHLRDKKDDIAKLIKSGSVKAVTEELDKCVCLCANCHRKVHAGLIDLSDYLSSSP